MRESMNHSELVAEFFKNPRPYLQRSYNIRLRSEVIQEMVGNRTFSDILDIGCGDGSLSVPLLTQSNRLVLVDLSAQMLSEALSRIASDAINNVHTVNGDLMQVTLPRERYDLILCMGVLAHVESPDKLISKVSSLLNPGGCVVISVSSSDHFCGRLRMLYLRLRDLVRPPLYRLKFLSPDKVLERFAENGIVLRQSFRYNFPAPGMDRALSNNWLYENIRRRYGTVANNTRAWFGSECIFLLSKDDCGSTTTIPGKYGIHPVG